MSSLSLSFFPSLPPSLLRFSRGGLHLDTKLFSTAHSRPPVVIYCYYTHIKNCSLTHGCGTKPSERTCLFPPLCVADVSVRYKHGRLVLEVPLPSRNENCLFFLRPMLMSVGDLITDLQREDPGLTASIISKGMCHNEEAPVSCAHDGRTTFSRCSQSGGFFVAARFSVSFTRLKCKGSKKLISNSGA